LPVRDRIQRHLEFVEQFLEVGGLLPRAREAVEYETVGRIRLSEALADDTQHDVVGNELARLHDLFRPGTEAGSGCNGFAQHIARRYLRNIPVGLQFLGLRTLPRSWCTQQNNSHFSFPIRFKEGNRGDAAVTLRRYRQRHARSIRLRQHS
jgi:hypothetical protein